MTVLEKQEKQGESKLCQLEVDRFASLAMTAVQWRGVMSGLLPPMVGESNPLRNPNPSIKRHRERSEAILNLLSSVRLYTKK